QKCTRTSTLDTKRKHGTKYRLGSTGFFFFQAEDGIRDGHVTGVQTCALPISTNSVFLQTRSATSSVQAERKSSPSPNRLVSRSRSEERRVGKECRSQWAPQN